MALRIEPLGSRHDRALFSCGDADLDDWFHRRARQDQRRNVARVFVLVDDNLGVIGFYSLSSFALELDDLPDELARRLPRYGAIPAALISRLARDERARGKGIGELLLADTIRRILGAGQSVAVFALVVDAKDEVAASFYETFGFQRFPSRPLRLFLTTSTAASASDVSGSMA